MKKERRTKATANESAGDGVTVLQFRVWLKHVSPMVWRRFEVPSTMTLRELHGVLQVIMGWESFHLFMFVIHAAHYGSWQVGARPSDVALDTLKLRKGSRLVYEYDLNIPWAHEIRLEDRRPFEPRRHLPICTGGDGRCPQEDCDGPEGWMWRQDNSLGFEMWQDVHTVIDFVTEARSEGAADTEDDSDGIEDLQEALERIEIRSKWLVSRSNAGP